MVYYDPQVLTNQAVYGVVGNYVIGWLKRTRWVPFINAHSQKVNRALTIGIALVSALGIEYSYSYTPQGHFLLDLGGLTIPSLFDHGKQFLVSYIAQQIPYHVMKFNDSAALASVSGPPGARTAVVAVSSSTEHASDHAAEVAEKKTGV